MQLYDINALKQWTVPEWAKKIIRDKYPSFEKKGITIQSTPERIKMVQMVPFNQFEETPVKRVQTPNPNSRKAKGVYIYEDDILNLQLSAQPPKFNKATSTMSFIFPSNMYELSAGKKVQRADWPTMFYLEFLCPQIKGNSCQNPSGTPFWQFEMKEAEAQAVIRRARQDADLKQLVFFDASEEQIESCYKGLNLKRYASIDENRVQLLKRIESGNELFKENALAILKTSKAEVKEDKFANESESELLNRLLENGTVKFEEGGWYKRDKRGDGQKWLQKPFYEDEGVPTETAFFNLVEHLKVNKTMLETLKK